MQADIQGELGYLCLCLLRKPLAFQSQGQGLPLFLERPLTQHALEPLLEIPPESEQGAASVPADALRVAQAHGGKQDTKRALIGKASQGLNAGGDHVDVRHLSGPEHGVLGGEPTVDVADDLRVTLGQKRQSVKGGNPYRRILVQVEELPDGEARLPIGRFPNTLQGGARQLPKTLVGVDEAEVVEDEAHRLVIQRPQLGVSARPRVPDDLDLDVDSGDREVPRVGLQQFLRGLRPHRENKRKQQDRRPADSFHPSRS